MTYKFKLARRLSSNHRALLVVASVLATTACGGATPTSSDTTPPPVVGSAGWLTVQLTTPNSNDGAIQFAISGPGIDSVKPVTGYAGHGAVTSATGHLVVTGPISSGAVARLFVRDVDKASQFVVTVRAAAARGTYALQGTSAYRASVVR